MVKVLIVEDDPGVVRFLRQAVVEAGYTAHDEQDGLQGWERIRTEAWDILLLDVMLPTLDGLEICRRARAAGLTIPILILTARDLTRDKIEGLDAGADDYVVKPFQVGELLARMRALLRRGTIPPSAPVVLRVGDLTLDSSTRQAIRGEKAVLLSATEYRLLEYLMRNAGRVLTRSQILEHVWEYDFGGTGNVLDVYISYLRSKIDKDFATPLLHTMRGVGYIFQDRSL
nr:response regulator transcription factor [Armatimonas rosea]